MSIHTSVIGIVAVVMSLVLATVLLVASGRGAVADAGPSGMDAVAPAAFY